MKTLEVL